VKRIGYNQIQGRTLHREWGLALHLESQKADEARRYFLDFGYTPGAYADNLEYLKIDPVAVDALIISHGHYDHCGGLTGFLQAQRSKIAKTYVYTAVAKTLSAPGCFVPKTAALAIMGR
jgi:7,8-dihydropterin-6-yl-methyl-4-(beta-D-ribofuranosyl)aminobenzene 5'-phosphate synthase